MQYTAQFLEEKAQKDVFFSDLDQNCVIMKTYMRRNGISNGAGVYESETDRPSR